MSVQQDKRVVKPSRMSERYARWFETRVLSTSPFFRYLVMYTLAIPVSIISAFLILHFINPLFVYILNFGIGVFLYLLFLNILQNRFRSSITDQRFSQIVGSVQDRIVTWRNVNVWPRQSPEPYIASTFNSFFDAVIISDSMIDLIKKMPESGEALLAFHLLRAPKRRNVIDFIAAIIIFFISTLIFTSIFMVISAISYSAYWFPIYSLIYIVQILIYFIAPVILIFVVRGAFWSHEFAFERASGIYQIHPQVAKDEVLSSQKLDDEASKSTIWVVREWERKKRFGRRSSISILVLIGAYSLVLLIFTFYPSMVYYVYMSSLYFIVNVIPFVIVLFIFFLLRRWDKRCMNQLYYETTQADEPIWVD